MLKNQAIASNALNSDSLAFSVVDPIVNDLGDYNVPSQNKTVNSFKTTQQSISNDLDSILIKDHSADQSDRNFSRGLDEGFSNTLEVIDASTSDTLFDLDASDLGAAGTASNYNLAASYYYSDPIDYGNPAGEAAYWRYQAGDFSCTVVAQVSVYESLTGYRVSETDASNYAQSQGWFDPQTGTPIPDTGKLLNAWGIATYGGENWTINDLAYALQKGDKPMVALDGNEIWYPMRDSYGNPAEYIDEGHTAWVTGIDVKPDGSINIILNDSGIQNGQSEIVSSTDFYNAWQDYGYFASIADNPFT
jgi:hypothetical protein